MLAVEKPIYAIDFSFWKRPYVRLFFQGEQIRFVSRTEDVPPGSTLIVWGMRDASMLVPNGIRILRIEDGFLRSVGLGADLVRPVSWVIDDLGIYYDATRPSRLEKILAETLFDDQSVRRAKALREKIVSAKLTKYNVGAGAWQRPNNGRNVILVPGQVETDASILYGAPESKCRIRLNMELLQAVRLSNPTAWVVYKPHPDVLAGLRVGGVDEAVALQWCDEQVIDVPMGELLDLVDEVHVLTSLTGFEALLRGKLVTCYGQPFYAGWGLTVDMAPISRRMRRLSLDELIIGALILYPKYVSRNTDCLTSPESVLDELVDWRRSCGSKLPWWRKLLRAILQSHKH